LSATAWKSSIVSSTSAALAIARRCRTYVLISIRCKDDGRKGTHSVCRTSDNVDDGNGVEEGPASNDIPKAVGIV
jgi:hypothetical protein